MSDLLAAASLLTAIVGVLYALWFAEIIEALNKEVPKHAANRIRPRMEVSAVWFSRALPLAVASGSVAATFLPPAVLLASESWQRFKTAGLPTATSYDPISTSLCLVEVFSLVLAFDCWIRLARLARVWKALSSTHDS
jgi:hypothetical protein